MSGTQAPNNALGALSAGIAAGLDPHQLARALAASDKTATGERGGVLVIDSSAAHPLDIAADLATARTIAVARHGRVYVGFHPHSDPASCLAIGRSLTIADGVVIIPTDSGGQGPGPGDAQRVAEGSAMVATVSQSPALAIRALVGLVRRGDVLALMGTGVEVTQIGTVILERLASRGTPALVAGDA